MTPSLKELMANAEASGNWDAVADWCEAFDWSEGEEVPVPEFYLGCAAATRPRDEVQITEAVSAARAAGTPWSRIAEILNTTPQTAEDHYAPLIETPKPAHR